MHKANVKISRVLESSVTSDKHTRIKITNNIQQCSYQSNQLKRMEMVKLSIEDRSVDTKIHSLHKVTT